MRKLFAAAMWRSLPASLAHRRRPIRRADHVVVPFPPGGSTDAAARIMAERMRIPLGSRW